MSALCTNSTRGGRDFPTSARLSPGGVQDRNIQDGAAADIFLPMKLYGGAITVDFPDAVDVLKFRQVPDTQEVFIFEGETRESDVNVIFDLLEMVPQPVQEAITVHVDDILEQIDAIEHMETAGDASLYLVSSQHGKLLTIVGLIRLAKVETDVLVTMNIPLTSSEQEQLQKHGAKQLVTGHIRNHYTTIQQACTSFKVVDWGLFGQ